MKYRVDLVEQLLIKIDKGGGGRAGTQSCTVNILNPSDLKKKRMAPGIKRIDSLQSNPIVAPIVHSIGEGRAGT